MGWDKRSRIDGIFFSIPHMRYLNYNMTYHDNEIKNYIGRVKNIITIFLAAIFLSYTPI